MGSALGAPHAADGEFLRRFPRVGGNRWGSRDLGSARILLLDSNARVLTRAERVEQESWLSSALAAADADPNIGLVLAAWHHPPFTNTHKYGDDRFSADSFLALAPLAEVGAVFCGHVHGYERFRAESVSFVVSGGGGAAAHPFPRDHARWRHTPAFDATALLAPPFRGDRDRGALARAVSHHLNLPAGPDAPPRWIEGDRFEIRPRQQ